MGKTSNPEILSGLFEGGNFPNAQIIVMTGDGVHVSYEACKKKDENETEITLLTASSSRMSNQIFE